MVCLLLTASVHGLYTLWEEHFSVKQFGLFWPINSGAKFRSSVLWKAPVVSSQKRPKGKAKRRKHRKPIHFDDSHGESVVEGPF